MDLYVSMTKWVIMMGKDIAFGRNTYEQYEEVKCLLEKSKFIILNAIKILK